LCYNTLKKNVEVGGKVFNKDLHRESSDPTMGLVWLCKVLHLYVIDMLNVNVRGSVIDEIT